ncbi:MAG: DUF4136 domain-containing protein [Planctomycetota bacterium]
MIRCAALALVLTFVVSACASGPRVISNVDPEADWAKFRTFGFFRPLDTDRGEFRSLLSSHLVDATTRQMQAAGYKLSNENPDLLINFTVSTRETVRTRPSSSATISRGRGRYGTWTGWSVGASTSQVVQTIEDTLALDVVDRARKQLVWEAAATHRLTDTTRQNRADIINTVVARIFETFPGKK